MINNFALIIGIIISYNIFKNKANVISLKWIIVSLLLINGMMVVTNVPVKMPIARWLIYSLMATVLYYKYLINSNWRIFPFKITIIVMIVASTTIGIVDDRLSIFYKLYEPFMDIFESYFILFIAYVTINKKGEMEQLDKILFYSLIVITGYGLYNYITRTNPYYMFILDHFFSGGLVDLETKLEVVLNTYAERYRATSTFKMTFEYGYASALLSLFFIYLFNSRVGSKIRNLSGAIMGIVGVILCGSRTVLISYIVSFLTFILFSVKLKRKFKYLSAILLCTALSYQFSTTVSESIDRIFDVFVSGGTAVSGSSVSMRTRQLSGAYNYFLKHPIAGNGYNYISKELGWGDRDHASLDENMAGFESIVYNLMIEQGLLGLSTKFFLFLNLISYFFVKQKRKETINTAGFGLSIVICFLLFSVGTGALGTWPITMFLLGATVKSIQCHEVVPTT